MPAQTIIKLKIRRGTNAQRKLVVLEQGELGYATDTGRTFVGDGVTLGGRPVGSVVHNPVSSLLGRTQVAGAVTGDIVAERSLMFQLTGSDYSVANNWINIGTKVDGTTVRYVVGSDLVNRLTVGDASLGWEKFSGNIIKLNGGLEVTGGLSVNVDNVTTQLLNNKVVVKGITENTIASTAFGPSISGGGGTKINVNFDPSYFSYNLSQQLSLSAIPPGSVKINSIDTSIIGDGLVISGGVLKAQLENVDYTDIDEDSGVISLKQKHSDNVMTHFENVNYNTKGIITSKSSMFGFILSASNSGTGAGYNGTLDQNAYTNQQVFSALYTDITTNGYSSAVNLSSAGFIVINSASSGDIAIPIFRFSGIVSLTGGPIT